MAENEIKSSLETKSYIFDVSLVDDLGTHNQSQSTFVLKPVLL